MKRQKNTSGEMMRGAVAGAAGVWVMDKLGWFMYNREDSTALKREHLARVGNRDVAHAAVRKIAQLTGANLPTRQPSAPGMLVHYALGVLPAALYAVARHGVPALRAGNGSLYGLGLFLLMDEILAPSLGLASGPTKYPWQAHARGLVSHVAQGVVTDSLLRVFNRVR